VGVGACSGWCDVGGTEHGEDGPESDGKESGVSGWLKVRSGGRSAVRRARNEEFSSARERSTLMVDRRSEVVGVRIWAMRSTEWEVRSEERLARRVDWMVVRAEWKTRSAVCRDPMFVWRVEYSQELTDGMESDGVDSSGNGKERRNVFMAQLSTRL